MSDSFREHKVMLCLSKELYSAFIRLQADKGLGRSFAGLLPFTEGLFRMGYLSKEAYETHAKKYSEPLVQPKPLSKEQLLQDKKFRELEKQFSNILKMGFNSLSKAAQKHWIEKAQEFQDKVPNAKLILALANGVIQNE